jgi:hypothetical protein
MCSAICTHMLLYIDADVCVYIVKRTFSTCKAAIAVSYNVYRIDQQQQPVWLLWFCYPTVCCWKLHGGFLSPVVRRNVCCVRISFFIQSVASSTLFIFFESYVIIYLCIVPVCFTWRSKMNKFEYFAHHFWFVNFARPSLCEIVPPFAQSFDHRRIVTAIEIKEEKEDDRVLSFVFMLTYYRPPCVLSCPCWFKATDERNELNFGCHFSQLWRWLLVFIWPSIRATYIFSPSLCCVWQSTKRLRGWISRDKISKRSDSSFSWLVIVEHKTRLFRAKLKIYYTRIDILYSKGE